MWKIGRNEKRERGSHGNTGEVKRGTNLLYPYHPILHSSSGESIINIDGSRSNVIECCSTYKQRDREPTWTHIGAEVRAHIRAGDEGREGRNCCAVTATTSRKQADDIISLKWFSTTFYICLQLPGACLLLFSAALRQLCCYRQPCNKA